MIEIAKIKNQVRKDSKTPLFHQKLFDFDMK